jgi:hypothetical protein
MLSTSRILVVLAAGAVVAAPTAIGKEGVRARLDVPLRRDAVPGSTITIAWTLSSFDHGVRQPFGAGGVFVRLSSASGAAPVKAVGRERAPGRYVADVRVPEGGIAAIAIGLDGTRIVGRHREAAPLFFPVDDDPFALAPAAARTTADRFPVWLLAAGALAAGALAAGALAALAAIVALRRAQR